MTLKTKSEKALH